MKRKHTFKKTKSVIVDNTKITHYHSEVSGLQIRIFDTDTHVTEMNCYIRTEADSDDGKGHALEHSIFNGSQTIPCHNSLKHVIQNSLNVSLNACTFLDYTKYILRNLYRSFLEIFPIYLDHVFFPALSADSFNTEVYNVTSKGDGGVIYNEMYNFKNHPHYLAFFNTLKLLYKGSKYTNISGGKSNDVRTLTVEKLRQYHANYYRPDNCMIHILGKVNHSEILESLRDIETKFQTKRIKQREPIATRPWTTPVPPMKIQTKTMEYPDYKETHGSVHLLWRKFNWHDFYSINAMKIIMTYICTNALLNSSMIDNHDPWATLISCNVHYFKQISFHIQFSTVPIAKLDKIDLKFRQLLKTCIKTLKLKDIKNIIKSMILRRCRNLENNNLDTLRYTKDFIYSQDISSWCKIESSITCYKKLYVEDIAFWKNVINTFTTQHSVLVSKPSKKLLQQSLQEDADRMTEIKNMGKQKLDQLDSKLQKSIHNNKLSCAKLISVIPNNEHTQLHHLDTINLKPVNYTFTKNTFMYNIDTKFTTVAMLYDISKFTKDELTVLHFLKYALFDYSTIDLNNKPIDYNDLQKFMDKHYTSYSISEVFSCNYVEVSFETHHSNIRQKLKLFEHIIHNPQVTLERTRVLINKYNKHVDSIKQIGERMVQMVHLHNIRNDRSNVLNVHQFINKNDLNSITQAIKKIKHKLFKQKVFYKIITNPGNTHMFGALKLSNSKFIVSQSNDKLHSKHTRKQNTCLLVTNSKSDSLVVSTPCFIDFNDKDRVILTTLCHYLATGRHCLREVLRDSGLVYGCNMMLDNLYNLLTIKVSRSSDISSAYKKIILVLLSFKKNGFDDTVLTSCKKTLLTRFINEADNDLKLVNKFHKQYCWTQNTNYIKQHKTQVLNITVDDLMRVFNKYVTHLCIPASSFLSIVTNKTNKPIIGKLFKSIKRPVTYMDVEKCLHGDS